MGKHWKTIKPMFQRGKWQIITGDTVMIMAGKDKGQIGKVTKVFRNERKPRVIVEGKNLVKKHIKRTAESPGGIISLEAPLHYSNISLLDPTNNKPVRIAWRYLEDGTKVRVSQGKFASGSIIPKPPLIFKSKKPDPDYKPNIKETLPEDVFNISYDPKEDLTKWSSFAASAIFKARKTNYRQKVKLKK